MMLRKQKKKWKQGEEIESSPVWFQVRRREMVAKCAVLWKKSCLEQNSIFKNCEEATWRNFQLFHGQHFLKSKYILKVTAS